MQTKPHTVRSTGTAIAAVLALTATPLLAQEASAPVEAPAETAGPPPIDQPESISGPGSITTPPNSNTGVVSPLTSGIAPGVTPPANVPQQPVQTEPAIVVPESVTSPVPIAAPEPEPAPEPVAEAAPEPVAEPSPAEETAAQPVVRQSAASEVAAPTEATGADGTEEGVGEGAVDIAPLAAADEPVAAEPVAAADEGVSDEALVTILGLLLALGVGVWGVTALQRSRRRKIHKMAVDSGVKQTRPEPVQPVATPVQPVADEEPERDIREWAQPAALKPVTASAAPRADSARANSGGLANAGAAIALPRTMPASFEERDALIKRMIAARPDRANPFTSPKARRRRARLILQSLDRSFETRAPWIDLSQYSRNWPALARHGGSAAA
ncbi:outer membrane biosynthesis protein TonB [Altererythrobacter atlanticus]|uniref:Uncharacterized protein n=1 Tax=Croceibacterium atlanticum TaxID=1267766 RepID=A0A0F7KT62_9SPHN|nr:hypothetical protein [Croceibacterium atlanticum]AKH41975.1 hypothetical protein WYH_00927 [Croceibacterium atlanticum]MBB5733457.1 outer membrane biosynthesis protein TonB [Croceibacterium atlanticum]